MLETGAIAIVGALPSPNVSLKPGGRNRPILREHRSLKTLLMTGFTISLEPAIHITNEQFYQLCRANPNVKFERSTTGELIVMAPTGGETGSYNSEINADFVIWNRQTQLGKVFDSPCGDRVCLMPMILRLCRIGFL